MSVQLSGAPRGIRSLMSASGCAGKQGRQRRIRAAQVMQPLLAVGGVHVSLHPLRSPSLPAALTFSMWGKRKSSPECMPVPRPIEDRMPRPTHHATYFTMPCAAQGGRGGSSHKVAEGRPLDEQRQSSTRPIGPTPARTGAPQSMIQARVRPGCAWRQGRPAAPGAAGRG